MQVVAHMDIYLCTLDNNNIQYSPHAGVGVKGALLGAWKVSLKVCLYRANYADDPISRVHLLSPSEN